jgi:hypothetical protein
VPGWAACIGNCRSPSTAPSGPGRTRRTRPRRATRRGVRRRGVRRLVGLGRNVQPEPAIEGERPAHIGDDHANKIKLWCHNLTLRSPGPRVLNESDPVRRPPRIGRLAPVDREPTIRPLRPQITVAYRVLDARPRPHLGAHRPWSLCDRRRHRTDQGPTATRHTDRFRAPCELAASTDPVRRPTRHTDGPWSLCDRRRHRTDQGPPAHRRCGWTLVTLRPLAASK